jgi:ribosomal protein L3
VTDALFEVESPRANTHACTGPSCHFCEWLDGKAAKAKGTRAVKLDPRWSREAVEWRRTMIEGDTFTADDLVDAIGLPDGHPNQIGALFRQWHEAKAIRPSGTRSSQRASNHARRIQVWEVRRGL